MYKLHLPVFLAFTSQPLLSHTIHLAADTRNTHLFSECPYDWTVTFESNTLIYINLHMNRAVEENHLASTHLNSA